MNILKQVTKGKVQKPYFMVLYGPAGIGKSYFASQAPNTLFIGSEEGTYNFDVSRAPKAKSFKDVIDAISELRKEKHDYQTVAIDSLSSLEPLVWEAVCKLDGSKTIEQAQGSYGKGYAMANKFWQELIDSLFALREEKNMNVIAIAHSHVKAFNDPNLPQPYDRYQLNLNEKAAAIWTREVDFLGFANLEVFLKEGDTEKKNRGLSEGKRVLYTERRPAFEAKNRLGLPAELPLSYKEFAASIREETLDSIRAELLQQANGLKDPTTKEAALKFITEANTRAALEKTRERLNQIA